MSVFWLTLISICFKEAQLRFLVEKYFNCDTGKSGIHKMNDRPSLKVVLVWTFGVIGVGVFLWCAYYGVMILAAILLFLKWISALFERFFGG